MLLRIACCAPVLKAYLAVELPLMDKLLLLFRIIRNKRKIVSATGLFEQLVMITALLKLKIPGAIVECGTYQGGSAANLSLACELTGRKLFVFDSFEGLPEPEKSDKEHTVLVADEIHVYQRGDWRGTQETVVENITKYGSPNLCTFVKGYFEDTLPSFDQRVAFVFCDADLRESVRACLRYLWPLMSDGGIFFTHEAHHLDIGQLFFDREMWGGIPPDSSELVPAWESLHSVTVSLGAASATQSRIRA
jgi:O-methyltransferase